MKNVVVPKVTLASANVYESSSKKITMLYLDLMNILLLTCHIHHERIGWLQVLLCIKHSTFQTKITAVKSVEFIGTFKRAGLQWFSSNKQNTLQIFKN